MGAVKRTAEHMTMEPWLSVLRPAFPRLSPANCRLTSPADDGYNCIAWASENSERWWWPDPLHQSYWPAAVPRVVTLDAFVQAFSSLGYNQHSDDALEPGLQKIAIFANAEGKPTSRWLVGQQARVSNRH